MHQEPIALKNNLPNRGTIRSGIPETSRVVNFTIRLQTNFCKIYPCKGPGVSVPRSQVRGPSCVSVPSQLESLPQIYTGQEQSRQTPAGCPNFHQGRIFGQWRRHDWANFLVSGPASVCLHVILDKQMLKLGQRWPANNASCQASSYGHSCHRRRSALHQSG